MAHQVTRTRLLRPCFLPLLGLSLMAASNVGQAAIVSGSSSSYGASVNLIATPILLGTTATLTVPEQPTSSGNAPGTYTDSDSAASLSVVGLGLNLATGLLTTNASSTIDGTSGPKSVGADATVNSLSLGVLSLLGLNSGVITSSAQITGDFGALTSVGSTSLANAGLTGLLNLGLSVNPAANTHVDVLDVLKIAGVSLILNEQFMTGDGISSRGLSVNAIHLGFTNFVAGLNILNGDIIIGHSEAQVSAVPLPSTALLFVSGIFGLLRFRRRSVAQAAM